MVFCCLLQLSRGANFFPDEYPEYCNAKPYNNSIPALSSNDRSLVSGIKQVIIMIRHGSRTPFAPHTCWKDYDVSWNDCNVTELMLASPASYNYSSQEVPADWLFRKVYDAFPSALGGNCFTGQLMRFGYDQEVANGKILRNAYLAQTDTPLNIFPSTTFSSIPRSDIHLRSDDEQRTLMSGQIMMTNFFDVDSSAIVKWHTGDDGIDQIAPNADACPAVQAASDTAYASPQFVATNDSNPLTAQLNDVYGEGYWTWYANIDCLMTTVCTNRSIPANVDTGTPMTQSLFDQAIQYNEYIYSYQALYNNSWYSKLGMGQTVYNMRTTLEAAVNNDANYKKFALWSAHDTSIMPMLAALIGDNWDGKWAKYAALVSFELYTPATGSTQLFRAIYNGKVITSSFAGCTDTSELCDVANLISSMAWAQFDMPCDVEADTSGGGGTSSSGSKNKDLTTPDWAGLCVLSALLGAFIGGAVVVRYNRYNSKEPHDSGTVRGNGIGNPLVDDASVHDLGSNPKLEHHARVSDMYTSA